MVTCTEATPSAFVVWDDEETSTVGSSEANLTSTPSMGSPAGFFTVTVAVTVLFVVTPPQPSPEVWAYSIVEVSKTNVDAVSDGMTSRKLIDGCDAELASPHAALTEYVPGTVVVTSNVYVPSPLFVMSDALVMASVAAPVESRNVIDVNPSAPSSTGVPSQFATVKVTDHVSVPFAYTAEPFVGVVAIVNVGQHAPAGGATLAWAGEPVSAIG